MNAVAEHPLTASISGLIRQWSNIMSCRHNAIERLLKDTAVLLEKRRASWNTDVVRLLSEAQPHLVRIESEQQLNASYFNIFAALGITRQEIIQSRFLVYLLSPREHHNQGARFLNAFLERIGVAPIAESDLARVKVRPEHPAKELGRMDIIITAPELLVVIENKIDAIEGDKQQVARYQKWIERQQGYTEKVLVFLTPSGREPETAIPGHSISPLPLSYADLAEIFAPLIESQLITPESVRVVIAQYITTCRSITFGEIAMIRPDPQLIALLLKPDNVRAALELEQQAGLARKQIAEEFCGHITRILQEKIFEAGLTEKWKAQWTKDKYCVEITTIRHNKNVPNYRLRAELIFTDNRNNGWYGWYRSSWVDLKKTAPETKALTEKMIENGSEKAEDWWVGWKFLRKGEKGYVLPDNDHIITCLDDNQSKDHPLATEIANEMWEMFKTYREAIEALPSFTEANAR